MPLLSSIANLVQKGYLDLTTSLIPRSWTQEATSDKVYLGAVYAPLLNGSYFAFGGSLTGGDSNTYRYSLTGEPGSWSTGTLPSSLEAYGAAVTDGTKIIVFPSGAPTSAGFPYTTNGTSWSTASHPFSGTSYQVYDAIYDGTRFLAVTSTLGNEGLIHSTSGTSAWSGIDVGSGGYAIAFDGSSRYIVLSAASTATHRTTTSTPTVAGNWSNITLPSSGTWASVAYGNGIWVAFLAGGGTTYATSTNGTTWTARTRPSAFTLDSSDPFGKVFFAFDKFWYFWAGFTYYSLDGVEWKVFYTGNTELDVISGWAEGPDRLLGFGYTSRSAGSDKYLLGK